VPTLYWKKVSVPPIWNSLGNWFTDAAATAQAANVPWVAGDSSYLAYDLAYATGQSGTVTLTDIVAAAAGSCSLTCTNSSHVRGGIFTGTFTNNLGRTYGGTFTGAFTNNYAVYGGLFTGTFANNYEVYGGIFTGSFSGGTVYAGYWWSEGSMWIDGTKYSASGDASPSVNFREMNTLSDTDYVAKIDVVASEHVRANVPRWPGATAPNLGLLLQGDR